MFSFLLHLAYGSSDIYQYCSQIYSIICFCCLILHIVRIELFRSLTCMPIKWCILAMVYTCNGEHQQWWTSAMVNISNGEHQQWWTSAMVNISNGEHKQCCILAMVNTSNGEHKQWWTSAMLNISNAEHQQCIFVLHIHFDRYCKWLCLHFDVFCVSCRLEQWSVCAVSSVTCFSVSCF